MPDEQSLIKDVISAHDWNIRVSLLRRVPEVFGTSQHPAIYSEIAKTVYVPNLTPDFAYIHWPEEYSLESVEEPYKLAHQLSNGFRNVSTVNLSEIILEQPST